MLAKWTAGGRLAVVLVFLLTGCATRPAPQKIPRLAEKPQEGFMTHRAILTARGKEYALTGYLAISEKRGMRLVVSEMFGQQIADVLVRPDGAVRVMKSSPMLKPKWIEKYLAADLKCLFGGATNDCPVTEAGPNHFVLKRRWYKLDLRIVETRPGPQPDKLFDEGGGLKP